MKTKIIKLHDTGLYDLKTDFLDETVKQRVVQTVTAQKLAAQQVIKNFAPLATALDELTEAKLQALISAREDVHGISTSRQISNVICFGEKRIADAVLDEGVDTLRHAVDAQVSDRLQDIFDSRRRLTIVPSGHFWYPQGSYMGWHTNSRAPGWRIYINYAEEPGKSFFRYRDQRSGEIITLWDDVWNMRVFRVTAENPLWHCVYSNTNRFSLGYLVKIPSIKRSLLDRFTGLFGARAVVID
jgi:hypothetical protein